MKKVVAASLLALASSPLAVPPAAHGQAATGQAATGQGAAAGQITIKDPAEYNAYTNAVGQSTPAAKAQAIEAFLTQYPNTVVKVDMLEQLVAAYQAANDTPKTYDAARRLLQVDPSNLRALTFIVYVEKSQAAQSNPPDQAKLDDAASLAQKGLTSPKPASMTDPDFQKLEAIAKPIFESTIAADDVAKKDYKGAIDAYQADLQSYTNPTDTQTGPGLVDTYYLGQAYLQADSKDPANQVNAIWYLTRAAQFAKDPFKAQIEQTAEYWYKKYHGDLTGFDAVKTMAAANVMPPADYKPVPAPPPPSPQDLAHQAVSGTADLKTMALGDKEFVLANGTTDDAEKVWATLKGQTLGIKGKVTMVAPDGTSVELAVTEDARQSNKADFTINMKAPLTKPPTVGAEVTYDATFDSYTQSPSMIILKDGEPPAAPVARKAPARRRG
ncbi:MAG TPA: hypothetical protein VGD62_01925 [Acidobacteriaceae bacterium]